MSVFYPNSDKPMPLPHREEREAHKDFLKGILKGFLVLPFCAGWHKEKNSLPRILAKSLKNSCDTAPVVRCRGFAKFAAAFWGFPLKTVELAFFAVHFNSAQYKLRGSKIFA
jgi:hypothetical protein